MNKKFLSLLAVAILAGGVFAACQREEERHDEPVAEGLGSADGVSTASIANEPELFINSAAGNHWIVAAENDLTVDRDVVFSGEFMGNPERPAEEHYRKLALYSQDADRNITNVHTLHLGGHRLVVESPGFKISNGIIDGDIYVKAPGFILENTIVEGDIVFANEEYRESANLYADDDSGLHHTEIRGEVRVD